MVDMDVVAFEQFLKDGGRSPSAARRAVYYVVEFETYLGGHGLDLDDAGPDDLESFVASLEAEPRVSAKLNLWGLRYYYQFTDDPIMIDLASTMREQRVRETPFKLRQFRGVNQQATRRLADIGIRSTDQLLAKAITPADRENLAMRATVPPSALEELVRLSDLARVPGLKSIRARLYLDAGIRSVETLATWDADELFPVLAGFFAESDCDGLPPLPGEVHKAVAMARNIPIVIEWQRENPGL